MKNNKGISRLALAIGVTTVVVIACIILIVMLNKSEDKDNNNVQLQNTMIENKQAEVNTNIIKTDDNNKIKELVFTEEYLKSGSTEGNTKIIFNENENSIVISITGVSDNDITGTTNLSTKNRWYKEIDLTNYKTLQFYARNGKDNGDLMVFIDKKMEKRVRYNDLPAIWTKYEIDVSEYKGKHTISFAGGYADNTGSKDSNTQYRNIKLK